MNIQELKVGQKLKGLLPNQIVEIVAVNFFDEEFAEITFKDENGTPHSQILYSEQAEEIEIFSSKNLWKFNSDAEIFRLVSESYRISVAHLFEPYLAVKSSLIEPLPHQILAVYEKMLKRQPLRFVLADDPGAGKTIMTGLLIKELFLREDVKRCLIVCPGALVEQWKDELQEKFHINFEVLTSERINLSANSNIFLSENRCIVSMDILARKEIFQNKLQATDWDLIVCDEAHKMSATVWGGEVKYTKRFHLGKLLGKITRNFLLLTATPHNGKEEDFFLFMSLIDPDRFEGAKRIKNSADVSDLMRRLVKEDLLTFDGKPLFPERRAYTVNYRLSKNEMELYDAVTAYVSKNFNLADRLSGNKKSSVGFAMTILQRRLASSPMAIFKSLERRTEKLKKLLQKNIFAEDKNFFDDEEISACEEFPNGEFEKKENEIAERVTASKNAKEIREEIQTLQTLTEKAKKVLHDGDDRKWRELSNLLQSNENFSNRDKLIIFTEHRDTLDYLQKKISSLFGRENSVITIHGGLNHRERAKIQEKFKFNKNIFILLATDAAGEGINLQNSHLMINYDLPWNPNRLEQRFGRIHRIGQKKICHLWNLVANETREGQVFNKLLKKLNEESAALGGKVFDILGKISFDNRPLRDLLIEAVRYGENPETIRKLDEVVDKSFDAEKIKKILAERALTDDILGSEKVADLNKNIERVDVHRLQPHFIENFFIEAFKKLGGQIFYCKSGRYEIPRVPAEIKKIFLKNNFCEPVEEKYKKICFSKENCEIDGEEPAILISPGNSLLEAVTALILEKYGEVLRQGTIFIDENDAEKNFRLLFYIETKIQDGMGQIISKKLHFVEISETGEALSVNFAPYFDYESPSDSEREKIFSEIKNKNFLKNDVENFAKNFALKNLIPPHRKKVEQNKKNYLDKLEFEIKKRLTSEINFWDNQAIELREKDKLNSELATRRADELERRLNKRLEEIKLERKIFILPPVIIGVALIVPRGFFAEEKIFSADRSKIEKIAMNAVMKIEREIGNFPIDVSAKKIGYDIESVAPDGKIKFIEVKGRNFSAETVTISKNEIITALNSPENFILAIVSVENNSCEVVYLKNPFTRPPDFNAVSVNYKISALKKQGTIILQKNI